MIIEETENNYGIECREHNTGLAMISRRCNFELVVDKQQAAQLIEVLQKWIAGGEVE